MDVSRNVYSRDLKIAAMRALDAGSTNAEIARKYQVSPHLLERWRSEWRAKGDLAFPGLGRRGATLPAVEDARRIAELERKIGQLTMGGIGSESGRPGPSLWHLGRNAVGERQKRR